jgi:osmotically inducible protein OsmC
MEKIKKSYTATATNKGGRTGKVRTNDGMLDLELAMPKEIGGTGRKTNPEQLFAAAYASCFGGALAFVSRRVNTDDAEITVEIHSGEAENGGYGLAADIFVRIPQAGSLEEAQKLAELAHKNCMYSNAVKGNIEVNVKAVV